MILNLSARCEPLVGFSTNDPVRIAPTHARAIISPEHQSVGAEDIINNIAPASRRSTACFRAATIPLCCSPVNARHVTMVFRVKVLTNSRGYGKHWLERFVSLSAGPPTAALAAHGGLALVSPPL